MNGRKQSGLALWALEAYVLSLKIFPLKVQDYES